MGHPLVGDSVYGRPSFPRGATPALRDELEHFSRQALHAHKLEFDHPISGRLVEVSVRPPPDFRALTEALRRDAREIDSD
ncbi:MAG: RNA pseudouridine synthase, partial [Pseudomonadota bacterium]